MSRKEDVYKVVSKIPQGKVMTYGQIGRIVGLHPRQVGKVLHENPDPEKVPCHRVVNAKGALATSYAFGGGRVQRQKLEQEDIKFRGDKVNLEKYLYKSNH